MEEIKVISDDITIMRDGKWVATEKANEITTDEIINMMVGRDLTKRFPPKNNEVKEVILKVENLAAKNQPSLKEASFELHKGEILGIWLGMGLFFSGALEIGRASCRERVSSPV